MAFTHVTLTRDYDLATGTAPTGTVTFTLSDWLVNGGITVIPAPIAAPLDVLGQITVSLAANTDPATAPTDSYYTVREDILGQPQRSYRIRIPVDQGSTIDLAALANAYPDPYVATPPVSASVLAGAAAGTGSALNTLTGGGFGIGGYGTSGYGL